MPIGECSTRKQPHTSFGAMLKGNNSVKTEIMSLERLCVHISLPLTAACVLRELPNVQKDLLLSSRVGKCRVHPQKQFL